MKNIITTISLLLIIYATSVTAQSCLPEGITFTTQEQIDNFQTDYPGCTEIEGDVEINGENITNLNGMLVLKSIGGELLIKSTSLVSLIGLDSITSIGKSLFIDSNFALTSLTGLSSLSSIDGNLLIEYNRSLLSIESLENLISIEGELNIIRNYDLTSLSGLNNLLANTITNLSIFSNWSLNTCNLEFVCEYLNNPNGAINIYDNAQGCDNPIELATACGLTLSCLPFGNYHFNSQDEIDNFHINYPNCTNIKGDVTISGINIFNLSGLSQISSIEGNMSFLAVSSLASFDGLSNLSSIKGRLKIENLNSIINLEGLNSLNSVGVILEIKSNDSLKTLDGLNELDSVGSLSIFNNATLYSLNGIENLSYIENHIVISTNTSLAGITVFENLNFVGGDISFLSNSSLLNLSGLQNLNYIYGRLNISGNNSMSSLTGLNNLNSIGGSLGIGDNDVLKNLSELLNLNSINGDLSIKQNDSLESLFGLDNINSSSIDSLTIYSNPLLTICDVTSICDYLISQNGVALIYNNDEDCNSREQVIEACVDFISEDQLVHDIDIYPNPFTTSTTLIYELKQPEKVSLSVYNHLGQIVYQTQENQPQGKQQLIWNAEGYADGIYYYRLQVGDQVATGKLVKAQR